MKSVKLSTKLTLGFSGVILIAVALGMAGYYSSYRNTQAIDQVGQNILPGVQSLLTLRDGANAIKASIRTLVNLEVDPSLRQRQYETIAKMRERYALAWKTYEGLPQSPEKAALWKDFAASWQQYRQVNDEFMRLSREYDNQIEAYARTERSKSQSYPHAVEIIQLTARQAEAGFKTQVQEWKDLLLRGNNAEDYARHLAAFNKEEKGVQEALGQLQSVLRDLGLNGETAGKAAALHAEIGAKYRQALGSFVATNAEAGKAVDRLVKGMDRPVTEALTAVLTSASQIEDRLEVTQSALTRQALTVCHAAGLQAEGKLDRLVQLEQDLARQETTRSMAQGAFFKTFALAAVCIGLVGGALGAWSIIRSINRPIRAVAEVLSAGAGQATAAAGQVSASSQSLAAGASEQAASLEETSASLEEMSSMTRRNTENAEKANTLAREARAAADSGAADMQAMMAAMQEIKTSGDDIAKIIKTIDEISFQTNILALNAAVEAARAGEAGMGFAVVADEVRNLAQRAASSAKETSAKIENAVAKTAQGVKISQRVSLSLQQILAKVRQVDELVAEVASASKEQTQGIDQVNKAVVQMDKVTQATAATAEEGASAAEELHAQAGSLQEAVADLLRLVNGDNTSPAGETLTGKTGLTIQPTPESELPVPSRNGNGHFPPLSKPLPPASNGVGGGISRPRHHEFKDF